jgi:ribonucleoside-diphosphate reductase alpha chain
MTLKIRPLFSQTNSYDYDIKWETKNSSIKSDDQKDVFTQLNCIVPSTWSQNALDITASKYFKTVNGKRENSVKDMIDRVINTITSEGVKHGYLDEQNANNFRNELGFILVHQMAAFNSPVWFNVGVSDTPQASACFILSLQDSMDEILDWYKTEGLIFKGGSGSGVNVSNLRGRGEPMSGGGTASGALSFMKAADYSSGVIKSGGKTRRAAKMVVLNINHPDIMEFITCKRKEEAKAKALVSAGFDGSLDGDAYQTVAFQNANHSVRVTDEFMECVAKSDLWNVNYVVSGQTACSFRADQLLSSIAEEAHACGDPGLQFDDTIQHWHTLPNTGRINASNPCSEYMSIDDSACNLASINLLKFLDGKNKFKVEEFKQTVDILITAMDILVEMSSYPTAKITENAKTFRQLGLGYANLGAFLMSSGIPYDSNEGRGIAAAITSLLGAEAYLQSTSLAETKGSFSGFETNRSCMLNVLRQHRHAAKGEYYSPVEDYSFDSVVPRHGKYDYIMEESAEIWDLVIKRTEKIGIRNSQGTVLAPTGTISFMMDCDTTGIEPDVSLTKYKKLVGGGTMKIVNQSIERALISLNLQEWERISVITDLRNGECIESILPPEHHDVFDCALKHPNGKRSIAPIAHVKMMAAVQPFLSGAISKTVNMPNEATVEDIKNVYFDAWKMGLKSLAVYRDGSKWIQPLNTTNGKDKVKAKPARRKLPDERRSITHKFDLAGFDGYITAGLYDDGTPGELFVNVSKAGSTVSGLLDSIGIGISIGLQYGVPLEVFVNKYKNTRFEPSGFTQNSDIKTASSLVDYIAKWLESKFMGKSPQMALLQDKIGPALSGDLCSTCGSVTVITGTCRTCPQCGTAGGCG